MKLLIIAGPYEADRLRRAAVSAGFETVAVEPGESLSGWISASRPDLIVMAPKIVSPDPTVALGKVRAVPRGRVPIFLVGDAADEPRFKGLADGFFMRPVSPDDLIAEARSLLGPSLPAGASSGAGEGSGPIAAAGGAGDGVPQRRSDSGSDGARESSSGRTPKSGPHGLKTPPNLKPLVAQSESPPAPRSLRGSSGTSDAFLMNLDESIDAALEDDIREAIRHVGQRERSGTPVGRPRHATAEVAASTPAAGKAGADDSGDGDPALNELRDESSQKTLEVPRDVVARMASADSGGVVAGAPPDGRSSGAGVAAPLENGNLAAHDVAWLLGRCFAERLTGWLTFKRDGVEKAIVFERGAPILAGSNLPADRMGDMLVRQGRLTAEQQAKSVEILIATGRRLGVVLVESSFIKAGELGPLVRRHFEEIIYSLFAWETGEWVMSPDRPEKEETVLLTEHPAALILEGIRRKYSAARLRARLGGGASVLRVVKETGLSALLEQMAATDDERRSVGLFDGARALDDLVVAPGVDETTLLAVAWALLVLRRLAPMTAVASSEQAHAAAAPTGEGAAVSADGAAQDRERDREIDRARILARYALVREGDYFQVLGVSRQATAHEIKRAHQSLAREFARHALAPELSADLAGPLAAIDAVIAEGARVLSDARLRQLYQSHLTVAGESAV
ncbi:MAG TPA: DUF4388 domain-containing protein [Polyangia bacterium]|jgi:hypothetical protein